MGESKYCSGYAAAFLRCQTSEILDNREPRAHYSCCVVASPLRHMCSVHQKQQQPQQILVKTEPENANQDGRRPDTSGILEAPRWHQPPRPGRGAIAAAGHGANPRGWPDDAGFGAGRLMEEPGLVSVGGADPPACATWCLAKARTCHMGYP